jgi:hypothetical protein
MANDGYRSAVIDPIAAEAEVEQQPVTSPEAEPAAAEEPATRPKEKNLFAEIYEAKNVRDVIPRVSETSRS